MKVVIASDSFKGSLSSIEVAQAAEKGILEVDSSIETIAVNIADGGEGLVIALTDSMKDKLITACVSDPLGRKIYADYAISDKNGKKLAIIEMAAASGLPLLQEAERNPLKTSTYGTGELILDALEKGCRDFLIGIGGSATNDGGMGMLRALGWCFLDSAGRELDGTGASLSLVRSIDESNMDRRLKESRFSIACDVKIPFCGPQGTACIFSPQKGADSEMVTMLDEGLRIYANAIFRHFGLDISYLEGAGAAGGLGGAFKAFLGAELRSGIETVLDCIGFDLTIKDADLVITGEGRIDSQTTSGKAAAGVLRHCKASGVPCVAIGGQVQMCPELENAGFAGIFPITDNSCPLEEAMTASVAKANIARTVKEIVSTKLGKAIS